MMKTAWKSYHTHAWGYDFLNPQSHRGEDWFGLGYTIIDSIDTLFLMGLDDEFHEAKSWINTSLSLTGEVSFFETVIRCVGGLLSIYEMTDDTFFLKGARTFGDRLLPAFRTPTRLPRALIDLKNGRLNDHRWVARGTLLADAGSCSLEFFALTHHTGNREYARLALEAREKLAQLGPLPPTHIGYERLRPLLLRYSLDAFGDSYFEYLLKFHIYAPKNDTMPSEFDRALSVALRRLGFTSRKTKLSYLATAFDEGIAHEVTHLGFFVPGMLFLAAFEGGEKSPMYLEMAHELLNTEIKLYEMQPTRLGGETARFTGDGRGVVWIDDSFKLRPELIESLFYCWRVTHLYKARRVAWEVFESIRKYCQTEGGFTTIHDTSDETVVYDDQQESFFLSETLKYLYLLFSDDDFFSLEDYVFTTEAHPLRRIK